MKYDGMSEHQQRDNNMTDTPTNQQRSNDQQMTGNDPQQPTRRSRGDEQEHDTSSFSGAENPALSFVATTSHQNHHHHHHHHQAHKRRLSSHSSTSASGGGGRLAVSTAHQQAKQAQQQQRRMADAFSSSLASIAAQQQQFTQVQASATVPVALSRGDSGRHTIRDEGSLQARLARRHEEAAEVHSGSGGDSSSAGAVAVTNASSSNTTEGNSTSEDTGRKGPTTVAAGEGAGTSNAAVAGTSSSSSSGANNSSSGDDAHAASAGRAEAKWNVPHYHHHHHHSQPHHRQRKRAPSTLNPAAAVAVTKASDEYGLPVPTNDRFHVSETPTMHTSVVAHLPPPSADGTHSSSSSGSGGEDASKPEAKFDAVVPQEHASSAVAAKHMTGSLLQPRREPGFHTIRRTFNRFARAQHGNSSKASAAAAKNSETDSSGEPLAKTHARKLKRLATVSSGAAASNAADAHLQAKTSSSSRKRSSKATSFALEDATKNKAKSSNASDDAGAGDDAGGSSGSGTEGGYAGSASSNENVARGGSDSSQSVSSSEESVSKTSNKRKHKGKNLSSGDPNRPMLSKKQESNLSVSSDIADFSSGGSECDTLENFPSESNSISSSSIADEGSSADEQQYDGYQRAGKRRKLSSSGKKETATGASSSKPGTSTKTTSKARKRAPSAASTWPPIALQMASKTGEATATTASTKAASPSSRPKKRVHMDETSKPRATIRAHGSTSKTVASSSTGREGPILDGKPPILSMGCDVMAHILTFLEPPDIVDVLTMPLSKDWLMAFTRQPELWRVLCLLEPFKAHVEDEDGGSSDDSIVSLPFSSEAQKIKAGAGKFRLLYTSFVRCMRYLARIKDDALHGRSPSSVDYGAASTVPGHNIGANQNLQQFLARARRVAFHERQEENGGAGVARAGEHVVASIGGDAGAAGGRDGDANPQSDISDNDDGGENGGGGLGFALPPAQPIGVSDDGSASTTTSPRKRRKRDKSAAGSNSKNKIKFAHSQLTQRLLGPTASGHAGEVDLPLSCAIYSIINWMVSFSDVEGIQTMCLKVLPFLLENEQQRITTQRAGLTEIVLRGMVMFPDSPQLHTVAFHTIVLLARPLGGREGQLFHSSMVNSSEIFNSSMSDDDETQGRKNGIAVMLNSMRRFKEDEVLQAMSCWSLVNIALEPRQKEALVRLGGIEATTNAMLAHPYNAEVQFRALFALINLVIPSVTVGGPASQPAAAAAAARGGSGSGNEGRASEDEEASEVEILGQYVNQIVNLVVLAMKNFCSSEAILNRACLVLHNLSLTREYHHALLWTPNCFQMLEWCMANYLTDMVLQQSAAGTLHRLQLTLSSDDALRSRFTASLQAQQQASLEQAHREAVLLHQQRQQEEQN